MKQLYPRYGTITLENKRCIHRLLSETCPHCKIMELEKIRNFESEKQVLISFVNGVTIRNDCDTV